MSYERTTKQLMNALSNGKMPRGLPKTGWRNYVEAWPSGVLELHREIAASCKRSRCLEIPTRAAPPRNPKRTSGQREIN